ncbi:hypothetical protein Droror1_Dr00011956 [Drosera rotundifolia]
MRKPKLSSSPALSPLLASPSASPPLPSLSDSIHRLRTHPPPPPTSSPSWIVAGICCSLPFPRSSAAKTDRFSTQIQTIQSTHISPENDKDEAAATAARPAKQRHFKCRNPKAPAISKSSSFLKKGGKFGTLVFMFLAANDLGRGRERRIPATIHDGEEVGGGGGCVRRRWIESERAGRGGEVEGEAERGERAGEEESFAEKESAERKRV